MPQSHAKIYLHMVFSTKNREPWFTNDELPELHAYMAGISKNIDTPALIFGGVADHIHALILFPRTITVATWVEKVKSNSTTWYKEHSDRKNRAGFSWQSGYGAFSVSPSHVDAVKEYITIQAEHHQKLTFQEEYRTLLKKYEVEFDERYVWD